MLEAHGDYTMPQFFHRPIVRLCCAGLEVLREGCWEQDTVKADLIIGSAEGRQSSWLSVKP